MLPALAGLGVLLAAPAAGQTIIGADSNATIQLSDSNAYPQGGPFTIAPGVTVSNAAANAFAVLGTLPASLTNAGTIQATGHADTGIGLLLGGSISNNNVITAASDGIHTTNAPAAINNAGLINAGYDGISLDAGGTVSNAAGATITGGHIGLYTGDSASTVSNSGVITAGFGDGVSLYLGGNFSNTASGDIHGGYAGVYLGGSGFSMQNAGTISGADYGVLLHGNTLENNAGGVITGGSIGVYAGSDAMLSNAGLISGTIGLEIKGGGATIANTGTIASTAPDGDAINFATTAASTLILGTGAVLYGAINGGGSASEITLTGTGLLNNNIDNFGPGSALTVASNADWAASGSWSVASLTNNGIFQPGNLTTPLTLIGDYVQAPSGTMRVIISPTDSSHFIITGTAHLAGDLVYVFAPGSYAPRTYNFITASGGITGSFADPQYNNGPAALLGNALYNDSLNNGPQLTLRNFAVVNPFDASLFSAGLQAQAITAQQQTRFLLARAAEPESDSCITPLNQAGSDTTAHLAAAMADAFCVAGGWMQASFSTASIAASGGAPDNQSQTGGFLAGIDKPINAYGTRIGLSVGYDESWLHDNESGKAATGTTSIGLYAAQPIGRFTLAAGFLYGHGTTTTTRATGAGAATASFGSNIFSAAIQANTAFNLGAFTLTPAAGLSFAAVDSGSFSEHAGGAAGFFALTGASGHETSLQPFIQLAISRGYITPSFIITPQASIRYTYEACDRGQTIAVTALDNTAFAPPHNNLSPSTATLAAGLSAARNNLSLYAHYTAGLSGNWTAQSIQAGLQLKF